VRETVIDPRFANREREPGLDLLRALAIILVVIYHAGIFGFALPNRLHRFGWIGVDLFFVLSGYLIGGQLLAPLAREQPMNLPRFFSRRALRIMPAYFCRSRGLLLPAVFARVFGDIASLEIPDLHSKH
jgi:peptidoglycan/LPS O-acetylase OafA/YrhL